MDRKALGRDCFVFGRAQTLPPFFFQVVWNIAPQSRFRLFFDQILFSLIQQLSIIYYTVNGHMKRRYFKYNYIITAPLTSKNLYKGIHRGYTFCYFFSKLASGRNPPSCNLIGSESGQFFTILPANPGGIVGSFIHKFVCCCE